jgi:SAM-dependent methyltransferase
MSEHQRPAPSGAENPAFDWAAARGAKWRSQIGRLEAMLAPVDEPLIQAMRLEAPLRIADIGCGGGGTALEIARRAPKGSIVRGFDISPELLEFARTRERARGSDVDFELADVSTVPSPQPAFDRLVSRFGIMFFADPEAAFANLVDWLAPKGRFTFAAWGSLADNPWMESLREAAAEVVEVPALDLEAPGPYRYADADKFVALLERVGFGEVEVRDWRGRLKVGGGLSPAEAADFALASFSVGELLAKASDEARATARRSLIARLTRHEIDGVVQLDGCVHLFTGKKGRA